MQAALVAVAVLAGGVAGVAGAPGGPPAKEAAFESFFRSASGLRLPQAEAHALAEHWARPLTICRVQVSGLQALRDVMYATSGMDVPVLDLPGAVLKAAYHHVDAGELKELFRALLSASSVDLSKAGAREYALDLAARHADPKAVESLFRTLRLRLPKSEAQQAVFDLVAAGADPEVFRRRFQRRSDLEAATASAVGAGLDGLARRYAPDGLLYAAADFQSWYGSAWYGYWLVGPEEKRTARDGSDYSAGEFQRYFGAGWAAEWKAAPPAIQRRFAADGEAYTMEDFVKYFRGSWQIEWAAAAEIPDGCAGYNQETCKGPMAARCRWKWSGDWMDSCVPAPLASQQGQVYV